MLLPQRLQQGFQGLVIGSHTLGVVPVQESRTRVLIGRLRFVPCQQPPDLPFGPKSFKMRTTYQTFSYQCLQGEWAVSRIERSCWEECLVNPTSGPVEGKELILREAERLFSQRGYQGVSIRELAQACGMTNAALYYHFKDKEDLFYQMATRQVEQLAQTLRERAAAAGDEPRARLKALAHAYAEHLRQRQDTAHVYAEAFHKLGPQRARALHEHFRRHMLGAVAEVIRAGQEVGVLRPADPNVAAQAFLGVMGVLRFQFPDGGFTPQQVEQLVDIFLYGVVAMWEEQKP